MGYLGPKTLNRGVYLEKLNGPQAIEVLDFSTTTPKTNFFSPCEMLYCRKKPK